MGVIFGCVGVFVLLCKCFLVGDVVGYVLFLGIVFVFFVMEFLWLGEGCLLLGLLFGVMVVGMFGVFMMMVIFCFICVKEDVVLVIVLSVFFGFGMVFFLII